MSHNNIVNVATRLNIFSPADQFYSDLTDIRVVINRPLHKIRIGGRSSNDDTEAYRHSAPYDGGI
jgi:hypothetical protein